MSFRLSPFLFPILLFLTSPVAIYCHCLRCWSRPWWPSELSAAGLPVTSTPLRMKWPLLWLKQVRRQSYLWVISVFSRYPEHLPATGLCSHSVFSPIKTFSPEVRDVTVFCNSNQKVASSALMFEATACYVCYIAAPLWSLHYTFNHPWTEGTAQLKWHFKMLL